MRKVTLRHDVQEVPKPPMALSLELTLTYKLPRNRCPEIAVAIETVLCSTPSEVFVKVRGICGDNK